MSLSEFVTGTEMHVPNFVHDSYGGRHHGQGQGIMGDCSSISERANIIDLSRPPTN